MLILRPRGRNGSLALPRWTYARGASAARPGLDGCQRDRLARGCGRSQDQDGRNLPRLPAVPQSRLGASYPPTPSPRSSASQWNSSTLILNRHAADRLRSLDLLPRDRRGERGRGGATGRGARLRRRSGSAARRGWPTVRPLLDGDREPHRRHRHRQRLAERPGRPGRRVRRARARLPGPALRRDRHRPPGGDQRLHAAADGDARTSSTASSGADRRCRANRRCVAALGPKMLDLSARALARHASPTSSRSSTRRCARSGSAPTRCWRPSSPAWSTRTPSVPGPRRAATPTLYLGLRNYTSNLLRLGFTEQDIADGGSDRLIDAIIPHGSRARDRRRRPRPPRRRRRPRLPASGGRRRRPARRVARARRSAHDPLMIRQLLVAVATSRPA